MRRAWTGPRQGPAVLSRPTATGWLYRLGYNPSVGCQHRPPEGILRVMASKVRKAVFPAGGLGSRFLPATKAQPMEVLPLVDKPLIQYGGEGAAHSGIQTIIAVAGSGRSAIEAHFDVSFELKKMLDARGQKDLLSLVRNV